MPTVKANLPVIDKKFLGYLGPDIASKLDDISFNVEVSDSEEGTILTLNTEVEPKLAGPLIMASWSGDLVGASVAMCSWDSLNNEVTFAIAIEH